MDLDPLLDAMAHHPAGVAVISVNSERGFRGLTATSVTSVSLEPPLLVAALDSNSATRDAVLRSRVFNVNLLSARQEFMAERFAGRAPMVDPTWREVPHDVAANGAPLLRDATAWFECEVEQLHVAGDHDLVIGRVLSARRGRGEPLVYWDRAFWRLAPL